MYHKIKVNELPDDVLWTIWNFCIVSADKAPGSLDFCHHVGVDFASSSSAVFQGDDLRSN